MQNFSRRDFIKTAVLGTAGFSFSAASYAKIVGANSDIRVAVIGFNSRGAGHIATLKGIKGVRLVALCDVDKQNARRHAEGTGRGRHGLRDMRKLFENKDIDAVSIATPNHWHALATIWACQAGKDVYVEKPVSHNIFEGRKMVEAARKYNRIVQAGTQCRSSQGLKHAVHYVQAGELGKIMVARGFCYKARKPIGLVDGPQQVPDEYRLRPVERPGAAGAAAPQRRQRPGPLRLALVLGLRQRRLRQPGPAPGRYLPLVPGREGHRPVRDVPGGRLGYKDAAETPNTMVTYMGYEKAPMIFEVRGLPKNKAEQGRRRRPKPASPPKQLEHGQLQGRQHGLRHRVRERLRRGSQLLRGDHLRQGRQEGHEFTGKARRAGDPERRSDLRQPPQNWIDAVRSRNVKQLTVRRAGRPPFRRPGPRLQRLLPPGRPATAPRRSRKAAGRQGGLTEAFERMSAHLEANEVDPPRPGDPGRAAQVRPEEGGFVDNEDANKLRVDKYREPFTIKL